MLTPNKIQLLNSSTLAELMEWISSDIEACAKGEGTKENQVKLAKAFFTLSQTVQANGYEQTQFANVEEKKSQRGPLVPTPLGIIGGFTLDELSEVQKQTDGKNDAHSSVRDEIISDYEEKHFKQMEKEDVQDRQESDG